MGQINFRDYDIQITEVLSELASGLNVGVPGDEEVWAVARQDVDVPCFENVLIDLYFSKLEAAINEKFPGTNFVFDRSVNASASSFAVGIEGDGFKDNVFNVHDIVKMAARSKTPYFDELAAIAEDLDIEEFPSILNVDGALTEYFQALAKALSERVPGIDAAISFDVSADSARFMLDGEDLESMDQLVEFSRGCQSAPKKTKMSI